MSQNYYLHQEPYGRRHLGKTFYGGHARGIGFIWAIEPTAFEKLFEEYDPDVIQVVDEDGNTRSLRQFQQRTIDKVNFFETHSVGMEFS